MCKDFRINFSREIYSKVSDLILLGSVLRGNIKFWCIVCWVQFENKWWNAFGLPAAEKQK